MIGTEPSRDPLPYDLLLVISKTKLSVSAGEFWRLTFGEWWPLYNAVLGKDTKPLSFDEFASIEEEWASG